MSDFTKRYGPWALVAGGAQGIGEAYSRYAAQQGLNVAVLDISQDALDEFEPSLEREYGVASSRSSTSPSAPTPPTNSPTP